MNKEDVEKINAAIEKFESASGNNLENAQAIGQAYKDAIAERPPVATNAITGIKTKAEGLFNSTAGAAPDLTPFIGDFKT